MKVNESGIYLVEFIDHRGLLGLRTVSGKAPFLRECSSVFDLRSGSRKKTLRTEYVKKIEKKKYRSSIYTRNPPGEPGIYWWAEPSPCWDWFAPRPFGRTIGLCRLSGISPFLVCAWAAYIDKYNAVRQDFDSYTKFNPHEVLWGPPLDVIW